MSDENAESGDVLPGPSVAFVVGAAALALRLACGPLLACGAPPQAPVLDTSPVSVVMLYTVTPPGTLESSETCIPPVVTLPRFRWLAAMRSLPCEYVLWRPHAAFTGPRGPDLWTADCRPARVVPPGAGAHECYWEPL
jgi:hypothetical protein